RSDDGCTPRKQQACWGRRRKAARCESVVGLALAAGEVRSFLGGRLLALAAGEVRSFLGGRLRTLAAGEVRALVWGRLRTLAAREVAASGALLLGHPQTLLLFRPRG